jgi:hypothetical protein
VHKLDFTRVSVDLGRGESRERSDAEQDTAAGWC